MRLGVKRTLDITIAIAGLIILLPILVFVALLVKLKLGDPIFFRQTRLGLGSKPFTIIKFRTMRDSRDKSGKVLRDKDRLSPFGEWLRRSSLDELPELWNVLKGDMSLVGPRPLLLHYLPLYTNEQLRRHNVRPGLTGWAQVKGRNLLQWEEKFALDVWYVDNWSIFLDVKIIIATAIQVAVKRSGISAEGHETMPEFTGRKENHAHCMSAEADSDKN